MRSAYKTAASLGAIGACILALHSPAFAAATGDAFQRKVLGSNWVVPAPTLSVSGEQLVGSNTSIGYFKFASADNAASVVAFVNGTALQYSALALGDIGSGSNAFVKLQSENADGNFDHGAFYTGNNGSGSFFALSSEVSSPAIMDVSFCGTVATLKITAASGTQVYKYDYGTTFGNGAGLGIYGTGSSDNFVAFPGTCLPTKVEAKVIGGRSVEHDPTK